jgi:sirohydrochlorin ferrochelatase
MSPSSATSIGIVLVDHGSKRAAANDQLDELVVLFKKVTGAPIVEPAHMELAAPTIEDAMAACIDQGATEIVIHPYFLAPGRHSTEDIPRMAAEAAAQHGNIPFRVTEPLGLDERLCAVIEARIAEAVERNTVA